MSELDYHENNKSNKERSYLIWKSNDIIQNTRYCLSIQQQRIVYYLISKIVEEDVEFKRYTFDLRDLCENCGIEAHGQNYKYFKDNIKQLRDTSFWYRSGNKDMLLSWIDEVEIDYNTTQVSLKLDSRLAPYLLQIHEAFASFPFGFILRFKQKYSARIYEIMKSYANLTCVKISLVELKKLLDIQNEYTEYKNFRRFVLDKSLTEINKYTDITVSYTTTTAGRAVDGFIFTISLKDEVETKKLLAEANMVLNKKHKEKKAGANE